MAGTPVRYAGSLSAIFHFMSTLRSPRASVVQYYAWRIHDSDVVMRPTCERSYLSLLLRGLGPPVKTLLATCRIIGPLGRVQAVVSGPLMRIFQPLPRAYASPPVPPHRQITFHVQTYMCNIRISRIALSVLVEAGTVMAKMVGYGDLGVLCFVREAQITTSTQVSPGVATGSPLTKGENSCTVLTYVQIARVGDA